jgi:hypothetical protein
MKIIRPDTAGEAMIASPIELVESSSKEGPAGGGALTL